MEKKFKAIKDKTESATLNIKSKDGSDTTYEFKTVKEALNALTAYSAGYSKMIIHNAKMLVKVVNALVANAKKKENDNKTKATGESALSWDLVF